MMATSTKISIRNMAVVTALALVLGLSACGADFRQAAATDTHRVYSEDPRTGICLMTTFSSADRMMSQAPVECTPGVLKAIDQDDNS